MNQPDDVNDLPDAVIEPTPAPTPPPVPKLRLVIASIWILAPFVLIAAIAFFAWPWVKSIVEHFYE